VPWASGALPFGLSPFELRVQDAIARIKAGEPFEAIRADHGLVVVEEARCRIALGRERSRS
jgi:hypothetical protein